MRKDFALRDGRRIGVVTHRDGKLELIVSKADDPDATLAELPLTTDEAGALANLLGAPQLVAQLAEEQRDLPGHPHRPPDRRVGLAVRRPHARRHRPAHPHRGLGGRRDARRAGAPQPDCPDFTLTAGDLLVTVGTSEGLDRAVKILKQRLSRGGATPRSN